MLADVTVPCAENKSVNSSWVAEYGNPLTYSFEPMGFLLLKNDIAFGSRCFNPWEGIVWGGAIEATEVRHFPRKSRAKQHRLRALLIE
jgi:hypothetical protein